jgi:hypothetical protein
VTFCEDIDRLLAEGRPTGVRLGSVTEIAGPPGAGKTAFVLQAALDVAIPVEFGGVEGEAVVIDTEGGVFLPRIAAMAVAVSEHLARIARRRHGEQAPRLLEATTPDALLRAVHIARVTSWESLLATLDALPHFCAARGGRVRLIAIDSIAAHARYAAGAVSAAAAGGGGGGGGGSEGGGGSPTGGAPRSGGGPGAAGSGSGASSGGPSGAPDFIDVGVRARVLAAVGATLHRLATSQNVAVLITNHAVPARFRADVAAAGVTGG